MSLGDVIVERQLTDAEACAAIGTLFGLSDADILLVKDLNELPGKHKQPQVLCQKWELSGGRFHTVLSFQEGRFMELPGLPLAQKLSQVLDSNCLISDDSPNPYSWILVTPTGLVQPVGLDPVKWDREECELIVADRNFLPSPEMSPTLTESTSPQS